MPRFFYVCQCSSWCCASGMNRGAAAYLRKDIMRIKYWISVLVMVLCTSTILTSCEKDDFDEGIEMRMRNRDNGDDRIWLLANPSDWGTYLEITSSNNFKTGGAIADVGSVRNLGKIKSVPTSGWTSTIAVRPGHGYVVSREDKYARVYVKEWIEGTSGGILGAVILYQDNWK